MERKRTECGRTRRTERHEREKLGLEPLQQASAKRLDRGVRVERLIGEFLQKTYAHALLLMVRLRFE